MEGVNPELNIKQYITDAKADLTTITPDNGPNDDPVHAHQLSDDAAAHQGTTTSNESPIQHTSDEFTKSPFANATAPFLDANNATTNDEHTDSVGFAGDDSNDASRQHHLLRHSLPSELRGTSVLSHFGVETISDASKIIKKMSQRDLQAKFKAVYGTKTFSNNNNWLRRKLFESIGLDPSKGAVKKPGAGTQRRRRTSKPSAPKPLVPRGHRRSKAELEAEHHSVAEALLALGDFADMDALMSDDLEEEEDLDRMTQGSDGRVPSSNRDDDRTDAAGRGVPSVEPQSPRCGDIVAVPSMPSPDQYQYQHDTDNAVHSINHAYDWIAQMQHQLAAAAAASSSSSSPSHPAAVAALMSQINNPICLAAVAGNPHAASVMQAMMASGTLLPHDTASQSTVTPEMYQRMVQDAAAAAAAQQQHPHLAMMQQMLHGGAGPAMAQMPPAPPLFGSSK